MVELVAVCLSCGCEASDLNCCKLVKCVCFPARYRPVLERTPWCNLHRWPETCIKCRRIYVGLHISVPAERRSLGGHRVCCLVHKLHHNISLSSYTAGNGVFHVKLSESGALHDLVTSSPELMRRLLHEHAVEFAGYSWPVALIEQ